MGGKLSVGGGELTVGVVDVVVEHYKWKSAEFPEEYALVYTSVVDKSKFAVFRLSVKPQKVVFRVADCFCDDHPARLHLETIAERDDDKDQFFNYRLVRVVVAGTSQDQSESRFEDKVEASFCYNCEKKFCTYDVARHTEWCKRTAWEVSHECKMGSFYSEIVLYVNIKCDIMKGLSANFRGPFRRMVDSDFIQNLSLLIHGQVRGQPPKHINATVESMFTGKQYVLLKQGKGNSVTDDDEGKAVIINNSGNFYGNGNGCFN